MTSTPPAETSIWAYEVLFNARMPDEYLVRCPEKPAFMTTFEATGVLPTWITVESILGESTSIRESSVNTIDGYRVEVVSLDWIQQDDEDEWPEDLDDEGFLLAEAESQKPHDGKRKHLRD